MPGGGKHDPSFRSGELELCHKLCLSSSKSPEAPILAEFIRIILRSAEQHDSRKCGFAEEYDRYVCERLLLMPFTGMRPEGVNFTEC